MSPRERYKKKFDIPWLEHREGYPSPEERAALIEMRRALDMEFFTMIAKNIRADSTQTRRLAEKYTPEELKRAVQVMDKSFKQHPVFNDEAFSYREYRRRYAIFGGQRPYLSVEAYDKSIEEHLRLFKGQFEKKAKPQDHQRDQELSDLLLMDCQLWEDITPPEVPPRPASFSAPKPGSYSDPVADLLTWGADLNLQRVDLAADEPERWHKHIPALERMALDPGLLDGWPGEDASWAPWHALHLIGSLGTWENAASLMMLADRPNDWLSDRLPLVWSMMGLEVEPTLSMLLSDPAVPVNRRILAAAGLRELVEEYPILEGKLVHEFSRILQTAEPFDLELNARLVFILDDLGLAAKSRPAIEAAFEAGRVDTEYITLEDLDWDDDDWDDDYEDYEDDEEDD